MADDLRDKTKIEEILKQRAKEKTRERLSAIDGGDLTRGLGNVKNKRLVSKDVRPTIINKPEVKEPKPTIKEEISPEPVKPKKTKKTIGNIVVDESSLKDITNVSNDQRSMRKRLLIIALIIIIVLIWVAVIVALVMRPEPDKPNCHISLSNPSDVSCEILLNGEPSNDWIIPGGIKFEIGDYPPIYQDINLSLKIKEGGIFTISYCVAVLKSGQPILDYGRVDAHTAFTQTVVEEETYYIASNIAGNQTIELLTQIVFNDPENCEELLSLNNDNIDITFYIKIEKVM